MKIATITFARSTKKYDYVITKNSSPVIAGKEYKIITGASLRGPLYAIIMVKEVREVTSLPFNVKTSLHVDKNTMVSRRLTSEEIKKLRNRGCKTKKEDTTVSSKFLIKQPIVTDKEEKDVKRLDFLGQFERECRIKQNLIEERIKNSRNRRK